MALQLGNARLNRCHLGRMTASRANSKAMRFVLRQLLKGCTVHRLLGISQSAAISGRAGGGYLGKAGDDGNGTAGSECLSNRPRSSLDVNH
jgi:hypothetical protein